MQRCTLVAQRVCMYIEFFSKLSSRPRYEHSPSASIVSVFSILGSLNNCELLYYILEKAKPKQLHQSPRRNQGGRGKHSVSFPRMMMVGNMLYIASLALFVKKEYSAVATTPTNTQESGQTANGDLGHTVWHLVITFLLIKVTWRVMC